MAEQIRIGGRKIGDGERSFLALDLARAGGGLPRALELVDAAKAKGFDAVIAHVARLDDLLVRPAAGERGATAELRRTLERELPPASDAREIASRTRGRGLALIMQPYDLASVSDARELAPDAILLESSALVEEELILKAASLQKPVLLKVGGATAAEIETGLAALRKAKQKEYALLHAFSPWLPAPPRVDLRLVSSLATIYGVPVGYAETAPFGDPRACNRPVAACALGASILVRTAGEPSADACPGCAADAGLDAFVRLARSVEEDLGCPYLFNLNEAELRHRETVRKKTVAARDIRKGELITYRDFLFKLCDAGVSPDLSGMVIGRRALCDIAKNEGITPEMFMEG